MNTTRFFSRLCVTVLVMAAAVLHAAGCAQNPFSKNRNGADVPDKADGPGSVTIHLDRTWIRPAGFVTVQVQALDLNSNPTTQWTLSVNPPEPARIIPAGGNQALVTMDSNGIYEIVARNTLSGDRAFARVRVDDTPPRVIIESPQRGAFLEGPAGSPVTVSGYVETTLGEVDSVRINDRWLSLDPSNGFSTSIIPTPGINTIEAEAVDSLNNRFRSVTSFAYAPEYTPAASGGLVTVRMGRPTIDLVAGLVRELLGGDATRGVPPLDLTQRMNHPCSETTHLGINVTMDVTSIALGPVSVQLLPLSASAARLRAEISVGGTTTVLGWARFLGATHDFILTIGPTSLSATYDIRISPSGQALVTASGVQVDVGETDIDIEWAPDFIAGDVEAKVRVALETALSESVPALLAQTLGSVSPRDVAIGSQDYFATAKSPVWSYRLAGIRSDDGSVEVILDTGAYAGIGWGVPEAPGVAALDDGQVPTADTPAFLGLAAGRDTLNRFLFAVWKGGGLSLSFDAARFLPQLSELPLEPWGVTVAVNALLPPMVTRTSGDRLIVSLGDIQVDLFISSQMGEINATAYLAADIGVRARAGQGGMELETELVDLKMDITRISLPSVDHEAIEAYLEPLARSYLTDVVRRSAFVPLPEIRLGFMGLEGALGLSDIDVSVGAGQVLVGGTAERSYD